MVTRAATTGLCMGLMVSLWTGCADQSGKMGGPRQAPQAKDRKVLRHVVLFKFKEGTTPEQIKAIEDAFRALPAKIPAIHDLEWGTNVSVENHSQGYTHCFLLTFLSEEDRAIYLPHPEHKAFGKRLGPHLEKVLVVDYWTGK